MILDVVLPLDWRIQYTKDVLKDIAKSSVLPNRVICIDNSEIQEVEDYCLDMSYDFPIGYIKNEHNVGVNESWNMGIRCSQADLICILNNDLVLCPFLFEKIIEVFEQNDNVGLVVPTTLGSPEEVRARGKREQNRFEPLTTLEGWAFTLRSNLINKKCLIPKELFNFCGDNFLFEAVESWGYDKIKLLDAFVHHITAGVSFRSIHEKDEAEKAKLDHVAWAKWKEKHA